MEINTDILKRMRNRAGLTQKDMAELLGCTPTNYQQWETGRRNPKLKNVERIAKILNIPIDYLVIQPLSHSISDPISGNTTNTEYTKTTSRVLFDRLFDSLNPTGQGKVIDYTEDIAKIPEYRADGADPEDAKTDPCEQERTDPFLNE